MQEFLISTSIVALAEMGDKTQLLALLLSARFRKPIPILIAILLATLINHGISAVLGQWITTVLSPEILVWYLQLVSLVWRSGCLFRMSLMMKQRVLINGKSLAFLAQPLFYFSWRKLAIRPKLQQSL